MRIAFIVVAISAVVVLCVDIVLVLLSFSQQNHAIQKRVHASPAVTATPGSIIPLSLSPPPSSQQPGSASPVAGATPGSPGSTALPVSGTTSPATPLLEIAPSSLTFSVTQGQANPSSQIVTLANAGGSTLYWQENPSSSNTSWLNIAPAAGTLPSQQTVQLTVATASGGLAPGTYSTQVAVMATDSSGAEVQGSPQLFSVTLTIFQPCSMQVTPHSLSFSASLLQSNPPGQSITLKITGHCVNPSWRAAVDAADQSWLLLSATSGNQTSTTITAFVNTQNIVPATYDGRITFTVDDANGQAQGSPQVVTVTLTVL
jgi:hypothetical protein